MCIKGLVYRLSRDCHFDIDRDVFDRTLQVETIAC